MGSGIAGNLLRAGIPTTLIDPDPRVLATASDRVRRAAGNVSGNEEAAAILSLSSDISALDREDVVIEAVIEDEAIKMDLFRTLSGRLPKATILASNTSTIPISRMALAVEPPGRFAGLHFFHPVHRMKLVEVIRGDRTSPETISRLVALGRRLGKTPIVVRDGPGFFTTRVLSAYLGQALRLLESGTPIDEIDEAATAFGMPMGPIALLDLIGLDTALAISNVMAAAFPDRFRVSPVLLEHVQEGRLGRKTGLGFRSYRDEAAAPTDLPGRTASGASNSGGSDPARRRQLTDRLFLPMLLEAIRTLEEGIVDSPRDVDLGVVLGLGFPDSRGGILRWCDAVGAANILDRLTAQGILGPSYQPPAALVRMARDGAWFHPRSSAIGDSNG